MDHVKKFTTRVHNDLEKWSVYQNVQHCYLE